MRLLLTSISILLAAGCIGSVGDENPGGDGDGDGDGGGGGNKMGKAVYKRDVHPIMNRCSGGACHETTAASAALSKFYSADADVSYDAASKSATLVGTFSSIAPIITKIEAGHQNQTYSADDKTKILNWLSVETADRMDGNTPPPVDPKVLLREWSGCMSLENFNAANMTQAWATLGADDLRKCLNCHNGGVDGFLISANAQQFFDGMSQQAEFLLKYFSVNTNENKVVVNTGSFTTANLIQNHPSFPAATNAGMTALQAFYTSTAARKAAGGCDPARLKD